MQHLKFSQEHHYLDHNLLREYLEFRVRNFESNFKRRVVSSDFG